MKGFLFFFIVVIFFSCSSKKGIPAEVLSPPRMQAILWDMLRTDEFVSNYGRHDSSVSVKDKSTRLYSEVFRIHNTTKSQFEKSIKFYNLHPDFFKTVLDSLEKKKNLISEVPHKRPLDTLHKRPADSLHNKIKPPRIHP